MKVIPIILCFMFSIPFVNASQMSRSIHEHNDHAMERQQIELQQDMNFKDYIFRPIRHYADGRGGRCRDYAIQSRSNPYRHGHYSICDER